MYLRLCLQWRRSSRLVTNSDCETRFICPLHTDAQSKVKLSQFDCILIQRFWVLNSKVNTLKTYFQGDWRSVCWSVVGCFISRHTHNLYKIKFKINMKWATTWLNTSVQEHHYTTKCYFLESTAITQLHKLVSPFLQKHCCKHFCLSLCLSSQK